MQIYLALKNTPAGASTGSGEAVDLRDGGSRFGGADVMMAVGNVNARSRGPFADATRPEEHRRGADGRANQSA
jgi:enolase